MPNFFYILEDMCTKGFQHTSMPALTLWWWWKGELAGFGKVYRRYGSTILNNALWSVLVVGQEGLFQWL
jgi:hypothetical protein